MKRSTDQILTTHAGSLPRPEELRQLLLTKDRGEHVEPKTFDDAVTSAVAGAVRRQAEAGVSVISDGEQSKIGFAAYVTTRANGFDGPAEPMPMALDQRDFPEFPDHLGRPRLRDTRPSCSGAISWKDFGQVETDIANFKAALNGVDVVEAFLPAASPGSIANFHPNHFYDSSEAYLIAIADLMQREYEAIVDAGILLQLDCPDLALHATWFPDATPEEFRRRAALNVEALNYATRNVDPERVRFHVCWGAGEGPHNHDIELKDLVDILLKARPMAMSIVAANGRHEHEWRVWEEVKLPEGKVLIPGVIDSTTNIIEHPQVVADRIVRWARLLGAENIMAGVDCGFGTAVSPLPSAVDPDVAYAKLATLATGAAMASRELGMRVAAQPAAAR